MAWGREEVEATVTDYFEMLTLQLTGQHYNKSEHRRTLRSRLSNRSDGAIERKHQNISAILRELNCPWIIGYKPLGNYQLLLFEVVEERLRHESIFDNAALAAVQMPAIASEKVNFSEILVTAPTFTKSAREPNAVYKSIQKSPVKRDYLQREARNASLGLAGEEFIVQYERWRLISVGKEKLAEKVEHIAITQGDGLGFDILSFESNGRDRLIEVKTTSFGKETPFFITRSEVNLSKLRSESFHLYRLFEFRNSPQFFSLQGAVDKHCNLDPITYQARFN